MHQMVLMLLVLLLVFMPRLIRTEAIIIKWENIFTYNFNIKKDHEFTVTAVTSMESHNQTDKSWQKQDNIKNNSYLWHNMDGTGIVYSNYTMSKRARFGRTYQLFVFR